MKVSVLTDNRVKRDGYIAEHGLSIFIKHESSSILFDVGQTSAFCHNAGLLGIDLKKTDFIVLSHGHYDHCGGLIHFPTSDRNPKVYIHFDSFKKRYSARTANNDFREIGIPWSLENNPKMQVAIEYTFDYTQLFPGIHLISQIPSITDFEGIPKDFYSEDEDGKLVPDVIEDEQMLVIELDKGLAVFLGCSHAGVVNCLKHVQSRFPGKNIYSVVGGMHMGNVSPMRLDKTIQYMHDIDIQKIVPLHCTGIYAIGDMERLLDHRCLQMCSGDTFEL
jgi:7,8-dihydropterin-6-yl-methyl-4-(beta-D-ribofuranosyl)aminobenzene 5'-phosphate synthase